MIRILGNISGIICTIILFINFILYLLKDIYFKTNILNIKKAINSILPIFSKYHIYLIIICFISCLIHISCFFTNINSITLDVFLLIFLLIIITFNFNIFSKATYYHLKKLASYLIIILILFHILSH